MATAAGSTDVAAIGKAYFDAVAARDVDAMTACWEPGCIDELHGLASLRAPEEIRDWFGNMFRAVPDFRMEVVDLVATGDKVAIRWHMTGTFSGDATSRTLDFTIFDIPTFRSYCAPASIRR